MDESVILLPGELPQVDLLVPPHDLPLIRQPLRPADGLEVDAEQGGVIAQEHSPGALVEGQAAQDDPVRRRVSGRRCRYQSV